MYSAFEHKKPELLTIEELQTISNIDSKVYDKCEEIFGYIVKNHPSLLTYNTNSIFEDYKIYSDTVSIKYYKSHSNDFNIIDIPWNYLTDDSFYKDDLKRVENDLMLSKENIKIWKEKLARLQYEKLKKKFEKEDENK